MNPSEFRRQLACLPNVVDSLWQLIGQIPPGRVATCGALGKALGSAAANRWIGYLLLHHPHGSQCVCHRVVRAGGVLGSFVSGDETAKRRMLLGEGIRLERDRVDLATYGWNEFSGAAPLGLLAQWQTEIGGQVLVPPRSPEARFVAGVDVSYTAAGEGVAAYVLCEAARGARIFEHTVCRPVGFPYISSYLAFRELPLLWELLDEVQAAGQRAEVLLVDGSGTLHPRGAGIASLLGWAANIPTVGVTKKHLWGEGAWSALPPGGECPLLVQGNMAGWALRGQAASGRPLFVSPGHLVSVTASRRHVRSLWGPHRLPEPIYWADRLSRRHAANPRHR